MPQLFLRLISPAILCLLPVFAFCQARSGDVEVVVEDFVHAWNDHDTDALARLFVADADWITASGVHVNGRDNIQVYLIQEHATWAKATTMKALETRVRRISRDMAVVFFQWQVEGTLDPANNQASVSQGNNVFVVAKGLRGWSVVAGQVASRRAGVSSGQ